MGYNQIFALLVSYYVPALHTVPPNTVFSALRRIVHDGLKYVRKSLIGLYSKVESL